MVAYGEFGKETELLVQDSAALAAEGERVSFAQLQARASRVGQVLIGFFDVPRSVEQPLQLVINPEARSPAAAAGLGGLAASHHSRDCVPALQQRTLPLF